MANFSARQLAYESVLKSIDLWSISVKEKRPTDKITSKIAHFYNKLYLHA